MGQQRILCVTIGHIVADRSAGFEPKLGVDLREASVMVDQMGDRESERERARAPSCVCACVGARIGAATANRSASFFDRPQADRLCGQATKGA